MAEPNTLREWLLAERKRLLPLSKSGPMSQADHDKFFFIRDGVSLDGLVSLLAEAQQRAYADAARVARDLADTELQAERFVTAGLSSGIANAIEKRAQEVKSNGR